MPCHPSPCDRSKGYLCDIHAPTTVSHHDKIAAHNACGDEVKGDEFQVVVPRSLYEKMLQDILSLKEALEALRPFAEMGRKIETFVPNGACAKAKEVYDRLSPEGK